jgi:hypothetical protein
VTGSLGRRSRTCLDKVVDALASGSAFPEPDAAVSVTANKVSMEFELVSLVNAPAPETTP